MEPLLITLFAKTPTKPPLLRSKEEGSPKTTPFCLLKDGSPQGIATTEAVALTVKVVY